jgi:hypothetical protein
MPKPTPNTQQYCRGATKRDNTVMNGHERA